MAWIDESRKRKDGSTAYVVRWTDATGRECQRTFRTESAAKKECRARAADEERAEQTDDRAARQTFTQVADKWLAATAHDVRPSTLNDYRRSLRLYVTPTFGDRRIGRITSMEIEQWLHDLDSTPHRGGKRMMPSTVRHAYFPLQAVFKYALRHNAVRSNPCSAIDIKKHVQKRALPEGREPVRGRFLTREEVAKLAAELAWSEPVYGLLVRFAAATGLRASELAGLRLRDVRLARRAIRVERTVKPTAGGYVVDKPKTRNSTRDVPLFDDDVAADLARYLDEHPRRDELDAPLWPSRNRSGQLDYGTADEPRYWNRLTFYRYSYRPALRRAGLPATSHGGIRLHDLRHTCGSQWLEDGYSLFDVSRWLGHASAVFTDKVYAHTAEEPDFTKRRRSNADASVVRLADHRGH